MDDKQKPCENKSDVASSELVTVLLLEQPDETLWQIIINDFLFCFCCCCFLCED